MGFNTHDLGDLVRVEATFRDADTETPFDPDVVKLTTRSPAGEPTTYVYGDDAELVNDGVGEYHADIDADTAGTWHYRWWSTGDGQAAEERRFIVRTAEAI